MAQCLFVLEEDVSVETQSPWHCASYPVRCHAYRPRSPFPTTLPLYFRYLTFALLLYHTSSKRFWQFSAYFDIHIKVRESWLASFPALYFGQCLSRLSTVNKIIILNYFLLLSVVLLSWLTWIRNETDRCLRHEREGRHMRHPHWMVPWISMDLFYRPIWATNYKTWMSK